MSPDVSPIALGLDLILAILLVSALIVGLRLNAKLKTLQAGQAFSVPATAQHPVLRTGRPQLLRASAGTRDLGMLDTSEHTVANVSLLAQDIASRGIPATPGAAPAATPTPVPVAPGAEPLNAATTF